MNTILFLAPSIRTLVIIGIVLLVILRFVLRDNRRKTYDDNFGRPSDVLGYFNKGFVVDGTRRLTLKDSYRNMSVTGGVGSGKSTSVISPFLKVVDNASLIVNDPSGELLETNYKELLAKGYRVRVFRPRDPDHSLGYNVLERANTIGQINKTAQVIVSTALGKTTSDPFWSQSAISLISVFIRVLKLQPKEYQNLYNLRYLLELFNNKGTSRQVDALFAKADDATFNTYRSFVGYGEKTLQGIVATCLAALSLLQDMDVARTTSYDTFGSFDDLRTAKQAVFIQNNVVDVQYLQFITDCLYNQLFENILSKPVKQDALSLWFVLDEFGSSMRIPNAASIFATARKTRTGIIMVNQSYGQLVSNYSTHEAETIWANCYTKLYLAGGLDLNTARSLEQRSGKFEFEDNKGVRRVRELITTSEILQIPQETGLLDVGNLPLMKVSMTPYYKKFRPFKPKDNSSLELLSEVPETVPLLKLPPLKAKSET